MSLYHVHFTSNRPINKYDVKGKIASIDPVGTLITITPCSKDTALLYKDCTNFRMEEIVRVFTKSGPPAPGVGNATRKPDENIHMGARKAGKSVVGKVLSEIEKAAATGDMSGALNG